MPAKLIYCFEPNNILEPKFMLLNQDTVNGRYSLQEADFSFMHIPTDEDKLFFFTVGFQYADFSTFYSRVIAVDAVEHKRLAALPGLESCLLSYADSGFLTKFIGVDATTGGLVYPQDTLEFGLDLYKDGIVSKCHDACHSAIQIGGAQLTAMQEQIHNAYMDYFYYNCVVFIPMYVVPIYSNMQSNVVEPSSNIKQENLKQEQPKQNVNKVPEPITYAKVAAAAAMSPIKLQTSKTSTSDLQLKQTSNAPLVKLKEISKTEPKEKSKSKKNIETEIETIKFIKSPPASPIKIKSNPSKSELNVYKDLADSSDDEANEEHTKGSNLTLSPINQTKVTRLPKSLSKKGKSNISKKRQEAEEEAALNAAVEVQLRLQMQIAEQAAAQPVLLAVEMTDAPHADEQQKRELNMPLIAASFFVPLSLKGQAVLFGNMKNIKQDDWVFTLLNNSQLLMSLISLFVLANQAKVVYDNYKITNARTMLFGYQGISPQIIDKPAENKSQSEAPANTVKNKRL